MKTYSVLFISRFSAIRACKKLWPKGQALYDWCAVDERILTKCLNTVLEESQRTVAINKRAVGLNDELFYMLIEKKLEKSTFDSWWSANYAGKLGGVTIELAFKEVAEKAWNAGRFEV